MKELTDIINSMGYILSYNQYLVHQATKHKWVCTVYNEFTGMQKNSAEGETLEDATKNMIDKLKTAGEM